MKRFYKAFLYVMVFVTMLSCFSVMSLAASVKKVSGVTASTTATTVTLKWKKVSGATSYRIYRYNSKKQKYVLIKKTKKLTYTDKSRSSSTTYKYKVRALRTKKKKTTYGKMSSAVSATTKLAKVKGLKVVSKGNVIVQLKWNAVKNVTGYKVYVYDQAKKSYEVRGTTNGTNYSLKRLEPNTTYKIKVAAYRGTKNPVYGSKSDTLTVKTSLPPVSTPTVSSVTSSSYFLNWEAINGVEGYQIARLNSDGTWSNVYISLTNNYKVDGLSMGQTDKYKVRAFNADGSYGAYSAEATASTLGETPVNLKAEAKAKSVQLTWTGAADVEGYEVERYHAENGSWQYLGATENTKYNDTTVSDTSTYTYRVKGYRTVLGSKVYTAASPSVSVLYENKNSSGNGYSDDMAASGILGYLYDAQEKCFYTASDPWQRNIGYNKIFDVLAPFTLINFDTVRLEFDYKDKDWVLQLWKGQYGLLFYGAEIGIYNKPKDRGIEHYDCAKDDELIKMSMDFYEYANRLFGDDGWERKFSRPYGSYWWCTGFIPGNKFGNYSSLKIEARLTMTDYEMLTAVKAELEKNNVPYTQSGLDLFVTYH